MTNIEEAIAASYAYLRRACEQLGHARTEEEVSIARIFVESAGAQVTYWEGRMRDE